MFVQLDIAGFQDDRLTRKIHVGKQNIFKI